MLDFRLQRSVGRPHRNLSPWIGGGLLAVGGLGAIVAVALTPVRPVPSDGHVPAQAGAAVELSTFSMEPACETPDDNVHDLAKWTIGPHHFGPLVACRPITVESVQAFLPDYTVSEVASDLIVAKGDVPVLRISTYGGQTLEVTITTPLVATPWGIRVGDRVRALRAHHPDTVCKYDDEELRCMRAYDPDGYPDSLSYMLRLADLPPTTEDTIDLAQLDGVRIESIFWSNR